MMRDSSPQRSLTAFKAISRGGVSPSAKHSQHAATVPWLRTAAKRNDAVHQSLGSVFSVVSELSGRLAPMIKSVSVSSLPSCLQQGLR